MESGEVVVVRIDLCVITMMMVRPWPLYSVIPVEISVQIVIGNNSRIFSMSIDLLILYLV